MRMRSQTLHTSDEESDSPTAGAGAVSTFATDGSAAATGDRMKRPGGWTIASAGGDWRSGNGSAAAGDWRSGNRSAGGLEMGQLLVAGGLGMCQLLVAGGLGMGQLLVAGLVPMKGGWTSLTSCRGKPLCS